MKHIKIKKTIRSTRLLNILIKLNYINGWSENISNDNYPVYLVYLNASNTKQIHTFLKPSRQIFIKRKFIAKISERFSSTLIYLSTSKGLISLKEASNKNIGGVLFFRIT